MNKKKIIISILAIVLLLVTSHEHLIYASENTGGSVQMQNAEFEFCVEDLKDGVSIVMTKDENGDVYSYVCENIEGVPMTCSFDDGSIEVAILHVGFKNWNSNKGSLYFSFECDEATTSLQGNFYVKTTGWFPKTYWSGSNSYNMFGCFATTRYIKQGIDVGDADVVRVGFNSVTFKSVYGEKGWFSNVAQNVYK